MTSFFKVVLRTRDVEAARAFYAAVLGKPVLNIVQLHEDAVARGARPHWLGHLEVGDVDRAVAAFVQRGATALSPKWVNPEGLEGASVRDPEGAIVCLAKPPAGVPQLGTDVVWSVLHATDVERAKKNYGELFGWELSAPLDLGKLGVFYPFAWERGSPPVGSFVDITGRPGVHPHWLFHFRVPALDPAVAAVLAGGGVVIGPFTLPTGERIAVCDDPQGAAFALRQD